MDQNGGMEPDEMVLRDTAIAVLPMADGSRCLIFGKPGAPTQQRKPMNAEECERIAKHLLMTAEELQVELRRAKGAVHTGAGAGIFVPQPGQGLTSQNGHG